MIKNKNKNYYRLKSESSSFLEFIDFIFKKEKNKKEIIKFIDEVYMNSIYTDIFSFIDVVPYQEVNEKNAKYFVSFLYNNTVHTIDLMYKIQNTPILHNYNKTTFSLEKRHIIDYKKRKFHKYSKHNILITSYYGFTDFSDFLIKNFFFKTEKEANDFIILFKLLT